MMRWSLAVTASVIAFAFAQSNSSFDVLDFVNPLIGSTNGGNVFPGATLPYGMAKAVADTDSANDYGMSLPIILKFKEAYAVCPRDPNEEQVVLLPMGAM